jgi:dTDP-4-amino-4,6-dideoxygalactose transaminase
VIPYNQPYLTGKELYYINDARKRGQLAGDGFYTKCCSEWLEQTTGAEKVLLTHSCTAALEMAAILVDIKPGDEVIMPSYTFVSTANAFVLRGGVPVFVDIRTDTLNIDETQIEAAITPRTRAIVPVHYAGVSCEMDTIMEIAKRYNLLVIEDAAQGIMASYKGRALGSIGHLGTYSFHETKNVISGEGGALLINDSRLRERAEIIREKGTDRSKFFRGQIDKYSWVDIGSSYLPGEVTAAFLWAQLQEASEITLRRKKSWNIYHAYLTTLSYEYEIQFSSEQAQRLLNAHLFYIVLKNAEARQRFISRMQNKGINCVFHYVPLHSSLAGQKYGQCKVEMRNTEYISSGLVRLPMWVGLENILREDQDYFLTSLRDSLSFARET